MSTFEIWFNNFCYNTIIIIKVKLFAIWHYTGRAGLRSLGTLLPVLGVTWVFGIMAINEDTDILQYIFVAANSLQVRLAQDVGLFCNNFKEKQYFLHPYCAIYLFILIFQGFFIFVSHVLMNNKVSISMETYINRVYSSFFRYLFFLIFFFVLAYKTFKQLCINL